MFDLEDLTVWLGWRFLVCAVAGCGLATLIYYRMENQGLALLVAIPVGLAGIAGGIIWQRSSGE